MTRKTHPGSQVSKPFDSPLSPALDRRRRRSVVATLSTILVLLLTLFGANAMVSAQSDPSMPPGSNGIAPEPLGSGRPSGAPGYAMGFVRLTFAPGATLNSHTHPGASILYIESGTLTYTLWEGTATITRAETGPGAAPAGAPLSPSEITLNVGDSLFEDADVIHTARNDGSEPAVVLITNLLAASEPVSTFLEGTPAP